MRTSVGFAPYVASQISTAPAQPQSANAPGGAPGDLAKLKKAAGDFEAMLLNSLWQSMKGTFSSEDDDGDGDTILTSFDDWGMQAVSSAAGSAGALGFKSLILQHLSPLADLSGQGKV